MTSYRNSLQRSIRPTLTEDQRRIQRQVLSSDNKKRLQALDKHKRLYYLLDEACGQEEVWTLLAPDGFPGGWYSERANADILPVWPHDEFTEPFLAEKKQDWRSAPIPIDDWIDIVTPEIKKLDYKIAIFPVIDQGHALFSPGEFVDELETFWKGFAKSLI